MTWQIPWVIAGVDEIPLDVARVFAYVSTAGRDGVVGGNDLLVSQTSTASAAISVAPGVFATVSKFLGASYESYIGRNSGTSVTTAVSNTGASSRSDLVYAHITDPGQSGQPATAAAVETRVITGVASDVTTLQQVPGYANQSGLALARITRPANSTTVLNSHITDLRLQIEDTTSPIGHIVMWAATAAPSSWLICQGQAVSRTTYSRLFGIIGTVYGSGDGSTTFNIPNLSGKFPLGVSGPHPLAQTGGAETHAITIAELPSHSHGGATGTAGYHGHGGFTSTEGAHTHNFQYPNTQSGVQLSGGATVADDAGFMTNTTSAGAHNHAIANDGYHTHTIAAEGGGTAMSLMPPYTVVNFIIKAA